MPFYGVGFTIMDMPYYSVEAENEDEAEKKARECLTDDYPGVDNAECISVDLEGE